MGHLCSRIAKNSYVSYILAVGLLIGLACALSACGGDDDPAAPTAGPSFAPTSGTVSDLPAGADPADYTVASGSGSVGVGANGGFSIEASRTRPQLFSLHRSDGRVVHLSIFSGRDDRTVVFSAEETAHALIYLHPLLTTESTADWSDARSIVASRAGFADLVDIIAASSAAGGAPGDDDPVVTAALAQVYGEMGTYLWDNFHYWKNADKSSQVGPAGGVEVIALDANSSQATFRLQNERRRWLAIYATRHTDAGYGEPELLELLPAPRISFFSWVIDGIGDKAVTSAQHTVSTTGCDQLFVASFGLGLGELNEDDWNRAYPMMLCPFVFDYGLALAEVVRGVSGMNAQGDPLDDPMFRMVAAVQDFGGSELSAELATAVRMQDSAGLTTAALHASLATILDDTDAYAATLIEQVRHDEGSDDADELVADFISALSGGWIWIDAAIAQSEGMRTLGSTMAMPSVTYHRIDLDDAPSYEYTITGKIRDAVSEYSVAYATVTLFDADDRPIAAVETNSSGSFSFEAPSGDLTMRFARRGYRGFDRAFTLYEDDAATFDIGYIDLVPAHEWPCWLQGIVTNAVTGEQVTDVPVELLLGHDRNSTNLVATTTSAAQGDSLGYYEFNELIPGSYTVRTNEPGFNPSTSFVTLRPGHVESAYQLVMSPEGSTVLRIVLTWGLNPSDLDSHLIVPEGEGAQFEVRWNHRGSFVSWPYADLDVDDVTSYGPETITITQPQPGVYSYAVYRYSGTGSLLTSNARVMVYGSEGLIRQWNVPSAGSGDWWYVFDLDAPTEHLSSVNIVQSSPPAGMAGSKAAAAKD